MDFLHRTRNLDATLFTIYDDEDDSDEEASSSSGVANAAAFEQLDAADATAEVLSRKRGRRKRVRDEEFENDARTKQQQLSAFQLEVEVAEALGLHPHSLNRHETGVLDALGDLPEEVYFLIRNHILALWRADVSRYLTEEAAAKRIQARYRHLVSAAWHFLDREGFINWGAAPAITDRAVPEQPYTVIVIGAGLAGLAAARQLRNKGFKVLVLEGGDRPGGRVYTYRLEGGGQAAVADLGGSIITGTHSNPLAVLARQLGLPMHHIRSADVPLYLRDGSELDSRMDKEADVWFNTTLESSAMLREQMPCSTAISMQAAITALKQNQESDADLDTNGTLEQGGAHQLQQMEEAEEQPQQQKLQPMPSNWQHVFPAMHQQRPEQQREPLEQHNGQLRAAGGAAARAVGPEGSVGPTHGLQDEGSGQAAAGGRRQTLAESFSSKHAQELLCNWSMANIEFANATTLRNLSMRHWDLDDAFEHPGPHVFLAGGNLRLVQGLARGIPIMYNSPARLVQCCAQGVRVHTDHGVYQADAAIVTVPLGVLKRRDGLQFQPPLPQRKQVAIRRLGFGCLNKVMLLFPFCFWADRDMFGHVNTDTSKRGQYYLFYAYQSIAGGAVLAALVAGDAAIALEQQSREEAVADVMALLRGIFTPQGVDVPEPLQAVITRWGADPLARGSYSSVAVGSAGPADYEALSQPVGNRLFFAGEATTKRYPATMHGAFATGMREAVRVMAALVPGFRSTAGAPPDVASAPATAEDVFAARQLLYAAQMIEELFSEEAADEIEPDLEVGAVRAMFGPEGTEVEDMALVQVSLGDVTAKAAKLPIQSMYLVVPRLQLLQLQDVQDEGLRLAALQELGQPLLARVMQDEHLLLLEAILEHRHGLDLSEDEEQQEALLQELEAVLLQGEAVRACMNGHAQPAIETVHLH